MIQSFRKYCIGNGAIVTTQDGVALVNGSTVQSRYSDAQLDDYAGLPRTRLPWRPPLKLTVTARFSHGSHELVGTGGFGFWNDPFLMTAWRLPALPRALWFFYSSKPSNMALTLDVPGAGWKAAMIDASRGPFLAMAPVAPFVVPLMRIRSLYRRLWPIAQRAMHVCESALTVEMTAWHRYEIQWQARQAVFSIDDAPVLICNDSPQGPLGLVVWLDNQFMVVTPWGSLQHGFLEASYQRWLEISQISVES